MTFPTVYHTTILKHPFLAILKSGTNFWGEQEAGGVGQILSEISKFPLHGISNGIYRTQTYLMNSNFCLFLGRPIFSLTFWNLLSVGFPMVYDIVGGTGQNIFGFKTLLP